MNGFPFRPERVRPDWRQLAIFWHWLLRDLERKDQHAPSAVRHIEGECSDDWVTK